MTAIISGIIPCHNIRGPIPEIPRMFYMDAEISLSHDDGFRAARAILEVYIPPEDLPPEENRLYYVVGKTTPVKKEMFIESDDSGLYDFAIQAETFVVIPDGVESPPTPWVSISGRITAKHDDGRFSLSTKHWVFDKLRSSVYLCNLVAYNPMLPQLIPLGGCVSICGHFSGKKIHGLTVETDDHISLPIDVMEFSSLVDPSSPVI